MQQLRALLHASLTSCVSCHLVAFRWLNLKSHQDSSASWLVTSCLSKPWQYKVSAEFITVSQQLEISSNFLNIGYVEDNENEHFHWLLWIPRRFAHPSDPPIPQPFATYKATAAVMITEVSSCLLAQWFAEERLWTNCILQQCFLPTCECLAGQF